MGDAFPTCQFAKFNQLSSKDIVVYPFETSYRFLEFPPKRGNNLIKQKR